VRVLLTRRRHEAEAQWDITGASGCTETVDLQEGDDCSLLFAAAAGEVGVDASDIRLVFSGGELLPDRLRTAPDGIRIVWSWTIDFYAGQVALELMVASQLLWQAFLDVRPHEGKLGKQAFDELVADLQEQMENVVFGMTAARKAVGRADASPSSVARFALMRAYIGDLEAAFARIVESPSRRLVAERQARPLDQVRQVDARSVRSIARNRAALAALGRVGTGDRRQDPERPKIDHPLREHTFDTAANRHTAAMIRQLTNMCRSCQAEFQRLSESSHGDPANQVRAVGMAVEAARLKQRLARLGQAGFLTDVPPVPGDTAALIAVGKDPRYARFSLLARRALSPRLALTETTYRETLWLRRTYELYEYWCFFRAAEALVEHWPEVAWECNFLTSEEGLLVSIRDGCSVVGKAKGLELKLTFQQTFGAYRPELDEADVPYSVSGERRPDIVLTATQGSQRLMILLDAKYRCSRSSIHSALADMHVYRDALRISGGGGRPWAGLILTPAHESNCDAYYTQEYLRRHGLGALDLAPRRPDQSHLLAQCLSSLIGSSSFASV